MSVLVFNYYPWFTKEFVGSIRRFYQLISDHLKQIPSYGPPGFHVGTGKSFFLPFSILVPWYLCSLSLISSLFLGLTFNIWYRLALGSIQQSETSGNSQGKPAEAWSTYGTSIPPPQSLVGLVSTHNIYLTTLGEFRGVRFVGCLSSISDGTGCYSMPGVFIWYLLRYSVRKGGRWGVGNFYVQGGR